MSVLFDLIILLLASLVQGNNPRNGRSIRQECPLFLIKVSSSILTTLIGVGQINSDGSILRNIKIDGHGVLQDGGNICDTLKRFKIVMTAAI